MHGTTAACCAGVPISIKHLPVDERPRERLVMNGASTLTAVELIAIVLGGNLSAAGEVVARFGSPSGIVRAALRELAEVSGVGMARACQIQGALELGIRAAHAQADRGMPLRTPVEARSHLRNLARLEEEELHVLALDSRQRLLAQFSVARGTQNVVHVSPRDVFRRLVREGAVAAIIAHNHPCGDPAPSEEDVRLTRRLRAAGEVVGVSLIDHLVIASGGFYSFADESLFWHPQQTPP